MDSFAQVRSKRGSLPAESVSIVEDATPYLLFRIRHPTEGKGATAASEPDLVRLAACARPQQWVAPKADILAAASQTGPLFGRMPCGGYSCRETLDEWGCAILASSLAVYTQEVVNGTMSIEGLSALGIITKRHVESSGRETSFDLFEMAFEAPGQYAGMFDALPLVMRSESEDDFEYAFVLGTPTSGGGGITVEVLVVRLGQEMTAADYAALGSALGFGSDVDAAAREVLLASIAPEGETSPFGFALGARLQGEDSTLAESDLPALAALVKALVAAHLLVAHIDVFQSDEQTGYLAFENLLGWLWYDFSRRLDIIRIGYCEQCGRPFSLEGHRGIARRFCSQECKTKAKNERGRMRRDETRRRFAAGEEVERIARDQYPDDEAGVDHVREDLSNWPELRHELDESIRAEGWQASPLLSRCRKEGLAMSKLLSAERRRELRRLGRR